MTTRPPLSAVGSVQHADDSASPRTGGEVPTPSGSATSPRVQAEKEAHRDNWRTRAKRFAREFAADLFSAAAFARALGTSESHGKKMFSPDDATQPLALGDVLAVGTSGDAEAHAWAEALLEECLRALREGHSLDGVSVERLQRLATRDGGTFADLLDKALSDGVISRDEARALLTVARLNRKRWDDVCEKLEVLL